VKTKVIDLFAIALVTTTLVVTVNKVMAQDFPQEVAPQINCDKATATLNMMYCYGQAFEAADKRLNISRGGDFKL
jgi:uncharacterized protein YecT (DUF1311 family)